jgi:hypothetical protein
MDPVELLRRRSAGFYDDARIAFDNGGYDVTALKVVEELFKLLEVVEGSVFLA